VMIDLKFEEIVVLFCFVLFCFVLFCFVCLGLQPKPYNIIFSKDLAQSVTKYHGDIMIVSHRREKAAPFLHRKLRTRYRRDDDSDSAKKVAKNGKTQSLKKPHLLSEGSSACCCL
jgi:hypothetical protein